MFFFLIPDRGNKSKIPEHFNRTISILVEHGANPNIKNHSNSDVTDLLTEFNNAELSMLVANKMHINKFGDLPNSFDSYMVLKDEDGKKNLMKIHSKVVPSTNPQAYSNKSRLQSDNVPEKPISLNTPGQGHENPALPMNLNKSSDKHMYNEMVDNRKITNDKVTLTNLPSSINTGTATESTKTKEDVLGKLMLRSDIIELREDLKNSLLNNISETIANNSEEMDTLGSIKTMKRKTPVKPGPSSKKQKPATDNDTTQVTLRSVRKAAKERT